MKLMPAVMAHKPPGSAGVSRGAASGPAGDLRPVPAQVRAPMAVLEGERSTAALDATRAFAAALPDGRVLLVPGAGERAWLERPDLFFPLLDAFLKGPASP